MKPHIVVGIEIALGLAVILFLLIRKRLSSQPYEFLLCFMRAGVNTHKMITGSELDLTHTEGSTKYTIKADRLYRVRPGRLARLIMRFKGVKQRFAIIFQQGKKTGISPPEVKVSARVLKEVNESRAIDRALRSEFKVPLDLKKILMIIGFVVVVIVAYVYVMGEGLI
jgi:hypothetical protein